MDWINRYNNIRILQPLKRCKRRSCYKAYTKEQICIKYNGQQGSDAIVFDALNGHEKRELGRVQGRTISKQSGINHTQYNKDLVYSLSCYYSLCSHWVKLFNRCIIFPQFLFTLIIQWLALFYSIFFAIYHMFIQICVTSSYILWSSI